MVTGDGHAMTPIPPGAEPREIAGQLHEQIAAQYPALVAAFRAIPPGGRKPGAMRALAAWKLEHRDGIEEAKTWPR